VAADAGGVVWADAHGFSTHGKAALAAELVALLEQRGVTGLHAGIADTAVAAQLAATVGGAGRTPAMGNGQLTIVPPGTDRAYVGLFPIDVLGPDPRLRPLLFGIGVSTCGELAALDRESIEVRLGPTAVPLWKLARADDPRLIFTPTPPDAPHASLDWVEYALKDPARLLFVINNLLDRVCASLASTGEGARELTVEFALTNRSTHVEVIRASRPTVNRRTWLRLIRTRVDEMKLHAAVTGITLRASRVAEREAPQADLFDRGLASTQATEDAVARLVEDQGEVVVAPQNSAHPLLDERTTWVPQRPEDATRPVYASDLTQGTNAPVAAGPAPGAPGALGARVTRSTDPGSVVVGSIEPRRQSVRITTLPRSVREPPATYASPRLHLQLAPVPVGITVETTTRRDHLVPRRYRDASGWHEIVNAAGPERVSGRTWDGDRAYAREYFRCVTADGVLVWLFRDAHERTRERAHERGRWFLHGWWD
jgi:protein ImuB